MNIKKFFLLIFALLFIIGTVLSYSFYSKIYSPNTVKEGFLYIPTNSSYSQVENLIRPFLKRIKPFTWVADKKKLSKYHKSR